MNFLIRIKWMLLLFVVFTNGSSILGQETYDCKEPMGMEDGRIKDRQLTASSYHSKALNTERGRLHSRTSWSSIPPDENQFFEVNFWGPRTISGISIQGRHDAAQWVTQYIVSYREDNSTWAFIADAKNAPLRFVGNSDSKTVVTNYFPKKITASRLRIIPKKWHGYVSMRVEILGCYKPYVAQCDDPMGMQSGQLLDDQITASSYTNSACHPSKARLNRLAAPARSWCANTNDLNQYLEIYFKGIRTITGVAIQGRGDDQQRVTHFAVAYRTNNSTWTAITDQSGAEQIFNGNYDSETVVTHYFDHPIICSRLRIIPKKWTAHISMRVEIIGCYEPYKYECGEPMGVQNGDLLTEQMTASSYMSDDYAPSKGRLHVFGPQSSWATRFLDANQYFDFYFKGQRTVTGISTQGRADTLNGEQFVTSYTVAYSTTGSTWTTIKDVSGAPKVFPGNYDREAVVTHYFDQPIICTRLRILPKTWNVHISMRMEILGCYKPYEMVCDAPIGIAQKRLTKVQITASSYASEAVSPENARLHSLSTWTAKTADKNQFLDFNFNEPWFITGISTQGSTSNSAYVMSYTLEYKATNGAWIVITQASGEPKIFPGNYASQTVITHFFDHPVTATVIRIRPDKWQTSISMRVEFHGCRASAIPVPTTLTTPTVQTTSIPTTTTTVAPLPAVQNCRLITLESNDTINMFETVRNKIRCTNMVPIPRIRVCAGSCASACHTDVLHTDSCTCVAKKTNLRMISLTCTDGHTVPFLILQPIQCTCGTCRKQT